MGIHGQIQQSMHGYKKFDARNSHASSCWSHLIWPIHTTMDQRTSRCLMGLPMHTPVHHTRNPI